MSIYSRHPGGRKCENIIEQINKTLKNKIIETFTVHETFTVLMGIISL